ncbi:MAG TPA: hypothetical protein VG328_23525 [Stellaceae bacterium]|jgi:hypothetical protein|nr:hypothetical protein [Stellaceae bacterium]
MRDDLLEAQAAIDWVAAQLPAFEERIEKWLSLNIDVRVEETEPPATHNTIVVVEKDFLPLAFNVEFGAYINVIRSSLDILATALAYRYGMAKPDKMYFPIVSATEFAAGGYKGAKFINGLPQSEREVIESLKPYEGGNEALWALHQLDIMRKHRRLIDVPVAPLRYSITGFGDLERDFTPVGTGWLRANDKTVIGLLRKGAPRYDVKVTPYVAINEPGLLERVPIVHALGKFASAAESIIGLFDK